MLVCSRFVFRHRGGGARFTLRVYRGMTASARQHSQASTTFAEASRPLVIWRQPTGNCRATASSFTNSEEPVRGGGRNAQATSCARAHFWMFPPANRLRASPVTTGSAAIIQRIRERSRFAATHSPPLCCALQQKNSTHLCTSCGRKVFLVEAVGKLNRNQSLGSAHHPWCPVRDI